MVQILTMGWVVHKFGGTSVASAERFQRVAEILSSRRNGHRIAVVVSAMSKVTDALISLTQTAKRQDDGYQTDLLELKNKHFNCIDELNLGSDGESLKISFQSNFNEIGEILRGVRHSKVAPVETVELISGYGEVWSAQILNALLRRNGEASVWLDARKVLVVDSSAQAVSVDWEKTEELFFADKSADNSKTLVITGFVASTPSGIATTLKRNGSDYSASIFGKLLRAQEIIIWTDVDGVMSADPRLVPDAVIVPNLSYAEASELAYFGAKVVHPDTMGPAIKNKIPIWIKNSFKPEVRGSKISDEVAPIPPIKGFASIEKMAIINLEGTGMVGVPGVSERLFRSLKDVGVSVVMISQASSEHSICIVVPNEQSELGLQSIKKAFEFEIKHGFIQSVVRIEDVSVMAMVGDGMAQTPGTAGRLFTALGHAGANVLAIAQGSSERNISAVIEKKDTHRALRAAHSAFFLSNQTLSVGVIGTGVVGTTFLDQLNERMDTIRDERGIDMRVRGIINSKKMVLSEKGLALSGWRSALKESSSQAQLNEFSKFICESDYPHRILIDLSASPETTREYSRWLAAGLNIITANKKAGSGEIDFYKEVIASSRKHNRYFMCETTVGAGLPILRALKDLLETGDELLEIEGVMSGTLSFLFNSFDGKRPFSEVLLEARAKGFTEPDPRDDLSGLDVARKLVILAREAGVPISLESVQIENLVIEPLRKIEAGEFLKRAHEMDQLFQSRFKNAHDSKKVLRYVGRIDKSGKAAVELTALDKNHPIARLSGSDNIFLFRTARYKDQPMVIQGPGAGPSVTAAGVFAELLRMATYLGAPL